MRERERLDDFRGGMVACRACKRLMYFDVLSWAPQRCCGFAYVPTERQMDLLIYDKLSPGDFAEVEIIPPLGPVVVPATPYDETMGEPDPVELVEEEVSEEALDAMVVTPEQAQARMAERLTQIKRRGNHG